MSPTLRVDADRLAFADNHERLNHNVFRYPAKFHPPVARALIERFSKRGQTVLDPFCGCGTTLVEGLVTGRSVVGTDVDPLAIFVTAAKIRRYDFDRIGGVVGRIVDRVAAMRQADLDMWGAFSADIDHVDFSHASGPLESHIPALPRIHHWFRRRAILQLAALRGFITAQKPDAFRAYLELSFASIIRNASNADPVPVSGLEVTSHMRRKEAAGRVIDPYALFTAALGKSELALRAFATARSDQTLSRTALADARHLSRHGVGRVDCVVTSPPYLAAVDYYRRHTLEMYWLGLTPTMDHRRAIMANYIGRDRVGMKQVDGEDAKVAAMADRRISTFDDLRPERARAFRHYCSAMDSVLRRLNELVKPGGNIVLVVGDVRFAGTPVPMGDLIEEIAAPHLRVVERLWYPLANRYMSYSRKNDANIAIDHVVVFRGKSQN